MRIDVPVFRMTREPAVDVALRQAMDRVCSSGRFILGSEVDSFEREFAAYCGTDECVGAANGTDALELALRAVGIGHGDPVATVANAGNYTSTALAAIGALPVYIDVDPSTLTMSPTALERQIDGVRAVVVTHLYGRLAAVEQIAGLASSRGIPVVEDCAQAHGAERGGRRAGSFGHAGCFSFYPTKNLGALGDAGAVVTSDSRIAVALRSLRQYGWAEKYRVTLTGGRNSRMDELQAAFLRVKLRWLDQWNAERVAIADRYRRALFGLPIRLVDWSGPEYVAHLFVVRTDDREEFRAYLAERGIGTDVHYPIPDHLQPSFPVTARRTPVPLTEVACSQVTTLPCFPGLELAAVDRVASVAVQYYDSRARTLTGSLV